MDYQTAEQGSSAKMWYIAIGVVVIALIAWYLSVGSQAPQALNTETPTAEQTQQQPLSSGDTTADISADLNQTSDDTAALDAAAAASAQVVQSF